MDVEGPLRERLVDAGVELVLSEGTASVGLREIARRAPGAAVLVQVDVTGAAGRGGCPEDEVVPLVEALDALGLEVRGLMAVGPGGPPEEARPGFRRVARLADRLGLPERSIGMSTDLEVGVEEGATMVRVGTALFGGRP